jgi:hypothetical protein
MNNWRERLKQEMTPEFEAKFNEFERRLKEVRSSTWRSPDEPKRMTGEEIETIHLPAKKAAERDILVEQIAFIKSLANSSPTLYWFFYGRNE